MTLRERAFRTIKGARDAVSIVRKKMKMKAKLELYHSTPEVKKFTGFKTAKLQKLVIWKFHGT